MTATDVQVRIIMREREKGRTQEQADPPASGSAQQYAYDSRTWADNGGSRPVARWTGLTRRTKPVESERACVWGHL